MLNPRLGVCGCTACVHYLPDVIQTAANDLADSFMASRKAGPQSVGDRGLGVNHVCKPFAPLTPRAFNVLFLVMATTSTNTRPNKRKLTSAEIAALLDASSDSEVHDSEFDDSDNEQVAAESSSDADSDSDATVDYEYDQAAFQWSSTPTARTRLQFSGNSGLQVNVDNTEDPLSVFQLFLTEDILNVIVTETNRRAAQLMSQTGVRPQSRLNNWTDVCINELRVFIAIILYQGIIQKPVLDMYWTSSMLLATPYVRLLMSRDRFSLLLRCLHFADNLAMPSLGTAAERSFQKVKVFFDYVISKFSSVYLPERDIAVDESLMLWKGRLQMKQYIPMKRARFGLKTYAVCECGSGYIWKSILHTNTAVMNLEEAADGLVSSRIVLTLVKDLLNQGHCVFMDNFYSSPSLYRQLLDNQTDAVGTVRVTRKNMPPDLKTNIAKGTTVARYTHDMMAQKWRDKRDVAVLSTYHRDQMVSIQSSRGQKIKPEAILTYNDKMGGVDLSDQQLTSYPCERKRHKVWYKKFFRHLLNQVAFNTYVLYKKLNANSKLTHVDFRVKLIERLLEENHDPSAIKRPGRPSTQPVNPLRLTARHFPSFIPASAGKQAPTRRCRVCCSTVGEDGKKLRKETRYYCKDCDAALCPAPCFQLFHTKSHFSH